MLASGSGGFQVDSANISDSPRYTFRGLMIDPARRFLPVVTLQAMMDAMSCERPHLSSPFVCESTVYDTLRRIRHEMPGSWRAPLAPPSSSV